MTGHDDKQWQPRELIASFLHDLRFAIRSLSRAKALTATVVLTLALGIGANAAIFTLVRGVLLRPLVNRDEDRLVYIQQSARGMGADNVAFSVPEIQDLRAGVKSLNAFGEFSTIGFTMVGLGDPREVRAGVVDGSFFEVMGLRPVLGRLLNKQDDGPNAAGACVLTHRFWTTQTKSDPSVLGKTIRLGTRSATIVGVLEPAIPYPAETELIANVVTSPHHLSATMVTGRVHRMTELFGRLAPGANLDSARAELRVVYGSMLKQHSEAYSPKADFQVNALLLRDQITSRARTVLLVLLGASILMFVIACSNVANLILARTVRREGELCTRAALGATTRALRQTLLAESLVLCGAGAVLGVVSAAPMLAVLAQYASRFSVRALDLTVDSSILWVGAILAVVAAVALAFVPRLPSGDTSRGIGQSSGSVRITGSANRRLRAFAVTQIAASFVLLAGAAMLINTLIALQSTQTGFDTRRVLTVSVPVMSYGKTPEQVLNFYKESIRQISALPSVDGVALGTFMPWRDGGNFGPGFSFTAEGRVPAPGEEDPRARFRTVSPGYFSSLGVPLIAGRDFNESDHKTSEQVVIVSQSLAQRMFPNQDAINHHLTWTDPVMKFIEVGTEPRRIIGVTADVDDENVVPGPSFAVYHPFSQEQLWAGNLFIHTRGNPYSLISPVTRIIRSMSADQPVERAATLEDIRTEVLSPDRLNTLVFGGFAAVALAIAVVGVGGVLAFSVSGRTREFGIRLAIGSQPRHLVMGVLTQGAFIAGVGIVAGAVGGYVLATLAGSYVPGLRMPGAVPVAGTVGVLLAAALAASLAPAARAARVDIIQALRSE
ncbi:ADOP family duplicated permease [Paludibaculum fermentans]|uniref:ADOP family duplicated permease n=1 Tax=Paludibaculum fermentans TaxID=1473598 RepID=UPI003EB9CAFD